MRFFNKEKIFTKRQKEYIIAKERKNKMEKTVCELFAGVGGFRVGLEKADTNWETVWANQWEPGKKSQHAYDCYIKHFGNESKYVNKDISSVDKSIIPNHNLLVGGFPCQDYSVARTGAKGIAGKKGVLWWQIRDTLEAKKPKFVLLENVDRLLKSPANQRGRDFGVILACFNDLGYTVEWRVINAADYGLAQRRRRTFIFACKNDTEYYQNIKKSSLEKIIQKEGFFIKEFPIHINIDSTEIEFKYKDLMDVSDNFKMEFKNSGVMLNGKIYTTEVTPIQIDAKPLIKIIEHNGVDEKDIIRKKGTPHEYHFREGAIAFPDRLDKPARTMLTSEGSLNRSTHVIEDPKSKCYRILTPIETERINGFPDDWTNTGMPE